MLEVSSCTTTAQAMLSLVWEELRGKKRRASILALILLASLLPVLRAQSTNASLTGRVADPSKALVADAKIAAVSAGTNIRYETTPNAPGEYPLASLPPNAYRIEIEKPGFKKLVKPDVTLRV